MVWGREREAARAFMPRAPRPRPGSGCAALGIAGKISPFPHGEWPGQAGSGSSWGQRFSLLTVEPV